MEKTLTAQRIRQIRRSFDWTQEELAEKCSVNRVTVSSWENGKYIPEGDSLVRLARVLNVSTDYLMGRTDQPEGTKKAPALLVAKHPRHRAVGPHFQIQPVAVAHHIPLLARPQRANVRLRHWTANLCPVRVNPHEYWPPRR